MVAEKARSKKGFLKTRHVGGEEEEEEERGKVYAITPPAATKK
jgi:hypothetical protein